MRGVFVQEKDIQSNDRYNFAGAADDLHPSSKPLVEKRRRLSPQFFDPCSGIEYGYIDVCELESRLVPDELVAIGEVEIAAGGH